MASFEFARGCVYRFDQSGSGGGGSGSSIIKMSPAITSDAESPVLTTGVQINDQDLVLPVVTLDGARILYSFGPAFGSFNIIGTALLGAVGGQGSALGKVSDWFKSNRVSSLEGPISVSLGGGGAYKVFVTGLSVAEADTEFHIQPYVIMGNIAEAP